MIEIFDKNNTKIAILENATNITETRRLNSIYSLVFSLPYNDPKNEHCQPFFFAKYSDNDRMYRILPSQMEITEAGFINYECEHVIATLIDNVLYGHHIVGNIGIYTRECINYILNKQKTRRWKLDKCDFSRQFEYAWEQETLLSALFSVATPLKEAYKWDYQTSGFDWKLSLTMIDKYANPKIYIRDKKNSMKLIRQSDPKEICTRLYPLGYGEGVNQLNISEINNGLKYLQSPQQYIDKYGLIERIWIDRRYENVESLKEAAAVYLEALQDIRYEYEVEYSNVGTDDFASLDVGDIVQIEDTEKNIKYKNYIVEIETNYDEIEKSKIKIANTPKNIAGTVADMMDRQRIEVSYAQGATQLYAQSLQANADRSQGAILNFYIPSEMRIVNKVLIKVKIESFRAYSQSTKNGGGDYQTTTGGGSHWDRDSTQSGGGEWATTQVENYVSGRGHNHGISPGALIFEKIGENEQGVPTMRYVGTWQSSGDHTHSVIIPEHNHRFEIDIPEHNHGVTIRDHSHDITPGIYRFGNPRGFSLYVNGKNKGYFSDIYELDITDYLLDNKKRISRGSWQSIEIRPDDLAYISLDMMLQGFVQSRGDKTV